MRRLLKIAVCDPKKAHRDALCDALAKLLFDSTEYRFEFFSKGEELVSRRDFQLVFLEIALDGDMNGFETAGKIKYISPETDIIFLTEFGEYIGEGYRYHAFDFLIKPVPMGKLQDTVERYLAEKRKRPADFLSVTANRENIRLPLRDIYFLESQKRKVTARTAEGDAEFYARLDDLENVLKDSGFVRCHQSYLVNARYIRRVNSSELELMGGLRLPVSRTHIKNIKVALENQTGSI